MTDPYTTLGLGCLTREGANGAPSRGVWDLCTACQRKTERIVRDLPYVVYLLSQAVARPNAAPDSGARAGKPGSRPPINLAIDALRSTIVYSALAWEEILRDHENLSSRRPGSMRDGFSIEISASIIGPRTALLASLGPTEGYFAGVEADLCVRRGIDGLRQLVKLWHVSRKTIGLTRVTIQLPGDCPSCGLHMLRRHHGDDTVWCEHCEGRWTYDQYTKWVTLLVEPAA